MNNSSFDTSTIDKRPAVPKWLLVSIIIVSFIGFLDAVYLTAKYYSGTLLTCSLFTGCEEVTTSSYATVLDVPVALGGSIFYLTVLILALICLAVKGRVVLSILTLVLPIGFFASLWFVYLQLFVLKAVCQYCLVSALTSTFLFAFALLIIRKK